MIARVWHGYTRPEHADAYEAMLKPELLPGIGKVSNTDLTTPTTTLQGTSTMLETQIAPGDEVIVNGQKPGQSQPSACFPP